MKLDIVIVTYNSRQWLENCINSILHSTYPTKNISLIFVDNQSNDETIEIISQLKTLHEKAFDNFQLIINKENRGFGAANNIGVKKSNSDAPYIFFLNADTEIRKDTISKLIDATEVYKNDNVAAFECRQWPYEHPKFYDPLTNDTPWCSGAALMVNKEHFMTVGMFDETIFMYAEDVDLSWNFLLHGYKLKYLPHAIVNHYSYSKPYEVKPLQFSESISNNLYLRYKYGTLKKIIRGWLQIANLLKNPIPISKASLLLNAIKKTPPGLFYMVKNRISKKKQLVEAYKAGYIRFDYWDYSIRRKGDFYECSLLEKQPLVSIVIRTCGRIRLLREALESVKKQTYPKYEVIVAEDGPAISKDFLEREFSDIPIKYICSGEKIGRSRNGNLGLQNASGKFMTFLDDDDLFFADHLETLVREIGKKENEKIFYSLAFETKIKRDTKTLDYEVIDYQVVYNQQHNRLLLTKKNYFPIQTVIFHRTVFEELGGFDETIDFCEDWDLWLRYSLKYNFNYIEKITSIYRVPLSNAIRQKELDSTLEYLKAKHAQYSMTIPLDSLKSDLDSYVSSLYMSELPISKKELLKKILKKIFF